MKRIWQQFAVTLILVSALVIGGRAEGSEPCSNVSLQGAYGFGRTGTNTATGNVAAVGVATFDGDGHFSGRQFVAQFGQFREVVFANVAYHVDPDCRGKVFLDDGITPASEFTLVSDGSEYLLLSRMAGDIVTETGKKIEADDCSVALLNGAYGFFRIGMTPQGPLAALGTLTHDGMGHSLPGGRQTISRNGLFEIDARATPNYEVNADCTGTLVSVVTGQTSGYIVVIHDGDEYFNLSLTPGNTVLGLFRRQKYQRFHPRENRELDRWERSLR